MATPPNSFNRELHLELEKVRLQPENHRQSKVQDVVDYLNNLDEAINRQWIEAIPVLDYFDSLDIFLKCQVTIIVCIGRAVVLLNNSLHVSIYKLKEINNTDPTNCNNMLQWIGEVLPIRICNDIPNKLLRVTNQYRLRLECQRKESLDWMNTNSNSNMRALIALGLQNFEKDRLYTFRDTVRTAKATSYLANVMSFITEMNPQNVSDMISYGEFVISYVEAQKRQVEDELLNGSLQVPGNMRKTDFKRQQAINAAFSDPNLIYETWRNTISMVRRSKMVNTVLVESGLSDTELIQALRGTRIGFGSEASAAYHVLKHPTSPPSAYVRYANDVINASETWQVTLTQDGDGRLLCFRSSRGEARLFEQEGRVLLCTFTPRTTFPTERRIVDIADTDPVTRRVRLRTQILSHTHE